MSHLYRAYYAIRGLTNRSGKSTNAIYGFTTMLRKLVQEEKPDYLAVALDLMGPTVRHELFKEYKATRPKMPEDLAEQVPDLYRLCEAMRVPVLSRQGYEADDVIGTVTRLALENGLEVVIVTIDKDMLQLVGERVSVLDTRTMSRLGPRQVFEKWGVEPERVIDVLSLVGDTSDNIPGAPGIGEKGAKALISEFGSLDNLLANAELVGRKSYRESLEENREGILRSRELLRIEDRLPLDLDMEDLRVGEPDTAALRGLFEALDFTTLLQELPREDAPFDPRLIRTSSPRALGKLAAQFEGRRVGVSAWFEKDDALNGSLEGLAFSADKNSASYVPSELLRKASAETAELFGRNSTWIVHDLKPFAICARRMGWTLNLQGSLDTMLMAYLLDPNQRDFSLSRVTEEYLGVPLGTGREASLLGEDRPVDLGRRAVAAYLLGGELSRLVKARGLERLLNEIEMPLVGVLADMELRGVRLDANLLEEFSVELEGELARLTEAIHEQAGEAFNINSPRQLAEILFEKLGLPGARRTGKGSHLSTGVEVLEELAVSHQIAQLLLDYRELAKLKSTYVDALPKLVNPRTGRIHTSYNQMVAATGRLSSSNPNLQNIPIRSEQGRRIRRAFVPDPGFQILSADYSQIELRVMAHLSEDPVLVDAFTNGEDIHERTAREVFGRDSGLDARELRRRAKVINFGIIYGLSAFGLARSLKIDRAQAQRFIDDYFEKYAGVRRWTERTLERAGADGYVTTMFGRIRQIPEINSKNRNIREFARRTAINAPIQGTAADLIKMAMVAIHRKLIRDRWESRLILQVHDELVFEAAVKELDQLRVLVREEMEGVASLTVPLVVELAVGPSWYDAK
jgi:DNA polymerase I